MPPPPVSGGKKKKPLAPKLIIIGAVVVIIVVVVAVVALSGERTPRAGECVNLTADGDYTIVKCTAAAPELGSSASQRTPAGA